MDLINEDWKRRLFASVRKHLHESSLPKHDTRLPKHVIDKLDDYELELKSDLWGRLDIPCETLHAIDDPSVGIFGLDLATFVPSLGQHTVDKNGVEEYAREILRQNMLAAEGSALAIANDENEDAFVKKLMPKMVSNLENVIKHLAEFWGTKEVSRIEEPKLNFKVELIDADTGEVEWTGSAEDMASENDWDDEVMWALGELRKKSKGATVNTGGGAFAAWVIKKL